MQRQKGDFLRGIRQGFQFVIMQRNTPGFDARARRVAGQQFPCRAEQHGAFTFRKAIQPAKDHHRRRPSPSAPYGQWCKMPRVGRESAIC